MTTSPKGHELGLWGEAAWDTGLVTWANQDVKGACAFSQGQRNHRRLG